MAMRLVRPTLPGRQAKAPVGFTRRSPFMSISRHCFRTAAAALSAVVALAAGAATANAGVLVASAPDCASQSLSKTFLPWWDMADYTALAGGDFEGSGSGWSMSGGAAIANGNESYGVGGSGDSHS